MMGRQIKAVTPVAEKGNIKKNQRAVLKRKDLQAAILQAAEKAGEEFGAGGLVSYLQAQALATPSPFLALLGKVLAESEETISQPIRLIELVPATFKVTEERKEKDLKANESGMDSG